MPPLGLNLSFQLFLRILLLTLNLIPFVLEL